MFIEDILDYYVTKIGVDTPDRLILESIWRQIQKGTALTDRQYLLVCNKLKLIEDTLTEHSILLIDPIPVKTPLRKIDRSKYIKIVDTSDVLIDVPYESFKKNWQWIEIRFPFNKKTITTLQEVYSLIKEPTHHVKGTHKHAIKLSERSAYEIWNAFKDKQFDIDSKLVDIAMQSEKLINKEHEYLAGFKKQKFINIKDTCQEVINKDLPEYDSLIVEDRRFKYGLNFVEKSESPYELTNRIVNRDSSLVQLSTSTYSASDLLSSIIELKRLPLLVVIDRENLDQLSTFFNASKYIVDPKKQICLFRVDNTPEYNINDFIKDNKFNNFLDNNIEIVYISSNNLPKLLLKTEWKPMCVISYTGSLINNHVLNFSKDASDLIILYDSFIAASKSRWSVYGNM